MDPNRPPPLLDVVVAMKDPVTGIMGALFIDGKPAHEKKTPELRQLASSILTPSEVGSFSLDTAPKESLIIRLATHQLKIDLDASPDLSSRPNAGSAAGGQPSPPRKDQSEERNAPSGGSGAGGGGDSSVVGGSGVPEQPSQAPPRAASDDAGPGGHDDDDATMEGGGEPSSSDDDSAGGNGAASYVATSNGEQRSTSPLRTEIRGPFTLDMESAEQASRGRRQSLASVVPPDAEDSESTNILIPYVQNMFHSSVALPQVHLHPKLQNWFSPPEFVLRNYSHCQFDQFFSRIGTHDFRFALQPHQAFASLGPETSKGNTGYISLPYDSYCIDRVYYLFYELQHPPLHLLRNQNWREMVLWRHPHHRTLHHFRVKAITIALQQRNTRFAPLLQDILDGKPVRQSVLFDTLLYAYNIYTLGQPAILLANIYTMGTNERFATSQKAGQATYRLHSPGSDVFNAGRDSLLPTRCPLVIFLHDRWPSNACTGGVIKSIDVWLPPVSPSTRAVAERGVPTDRVGHYRPLYEHRYFNADPDNGLKELPPHISFFPPTKFFDPKPLRDTYGPGNFLPEENLLTSFSLERAFLTLFFHQPTQILTMTNDWTLMVLAVHKSLLEAYNLSFRGQAPQGLHSHPLSDPNEKWKIRNKVEILARLFRTKVVLVSLDPASKPTDIYCVAPMESFADWPIAVIGIRFPRDGRPQYLWGFFDPDGTPPCLPADNHHRPVPKLLSRGIPYQEFPEQKSIPTTTSANIDSCFVIASSFCEFSNTFFSPGSTSNGVCLSGPLIHLYRNVTISKFDAARYCIRVFINKDEGSQHSFSLIPTTSHPVMRIVPLFRFPSIRWGKISYASLTYEVVITILDPFRYSTYEELRGWGPNVKSTPWSPDEIKDLNAITLLALKDSKEAVDKVQDSANSQYLNLPSTGPGRHHKGVSKSGTKVWNTFSGSMFHSFCNSITKVCQQLVGGKEPVDAISTVRMASKLLQRVSITAYSAGTKNGIDLGCFKPQNGGLDGEEIANRNGPMLFELSHNILFTELLPNSKADVIKGFDLGLNTTCCDKTDSLITFDENAHKRVFSNLQRNHRLSKADIRNVHSRPTLHDVLGKTRLSSVDPRDHLPGLAVVVPSMGNVIGTIVRVLDNCVEVYFIPPSLVPGTPQKFYSLAMDAAHFDVLSRNVARKSLIIQEITTSIQWARVKDGRILMRDMDFPDSDYGDAEDWEDIGTPDQLRQGYVAVCPYSWKPFEECNKDCQNVLFWDTDTDSDEEEEEDGEEEEEEDDLGDDSSWNAPPYGASVAGQSSPAPNQGPLRDCCPYCGFQNTKLLVYMCPQCHRRLSRYFPHTVVLSGDSQGKQFCYGHSGIQFLLSSTYLISALCRCSYQGFEVSLAARRIMGIVDSMRCSSWHSSLDISDHLNDGSLNPQVSFARADGSCTRFVESLLLELCQPGNSERSLVESVMEVGTATSPPPVLHQLNLQAPGTPVVISESLDTKSWKQPPCCLIISVLRKDQESSFTPEVPVRFEESFRIHRVDYVLKSLVLHSPPFHGRSRNPGHVRSVQ